MAYFRPPGPAPDPVLVRSRTSCTSACAPSLYPTSRS